jgi:CHAT domain-containing protein/tetratricopeptide (TPR) repeat protein
MSGGFVPPGDVVLHYHCLFKSTAKRHAIFVGAVTLVLSVLTSHFSTMASTMSDTRAGLWWVVFHRSAAPQTDLPSLELGVPIKKELAPGSSHSYRVALTTGQLVEVLIEQQGIRVAVTISASNKVIAEMHSVYGRHGPLAISFVASETAEHLVTVRSTEQTAPPGGYEIRVALRTPTESDLNRVAAQRSFEEGRKLRSLPSEESRRQAIKKYEEALARHKKIGDQAGEANTLQAIGLAYRFLGNLEQAAQFYESAASLQKTLADSRGRAFSLNYLGLVQALLGNFNKALESYSEALAIWQAQNDKLNEADTLNRIGGAYDGLGQLQTARQFFGSALELRRSLGDRLGEAQTLNNIGLIHEKLGESQEALDHYTRALSAFQAAEDHRSAAITLTNIGFIYASLGDSEKAMEYYEQARSTRKKVSDPIQEALTINNIGHLSAAEGEFSKAQDYYNQALKIQQEAKSAWYEAYTLISLGQVHLSLNDSQKAREHFERAHALLKGVGDSEGQALALDKLGSVQALSRDFSKSLENYDQALRHWRAVGNQSGEASTLYNIARADRDRGNIADAQKRIAETLKIVESMRAKVVSKELRAYYLASVRDYYDLGIDLMMQMHRRSPSNGLHATAFEMSEQGRARSLLEMLLEARINIREGVDPNLLERERSLQQQLNVVAEKQRQLLGGKHTAEQSEALEKELKAILTSYQEVQASIRSNSPNYAYLTNPEPLSLKDIQQVLDSDTLLLEFNLGSERSYLWAVSQTSIASFELPGRSEIEAASRKVYDLLNAPSHFIKGERKEEKFARIAKAEAEFPQAAERLAEMLIAPVASLLNAKRLVIVSDGALQYVPFAALPLPQSATQPSRAVAAESQASQKQSASSATSNASRYVPLIVSHEIVNLPSASALAVHRRTFRGRKPAPKTVAVLADPVYNKDDVRLKRASAPREKGDESRNTMRDLDRGVNEVGLTDTGTAIPRLPFSRQEAREIIKNAAAEQSKLALDFEASRGAALGADLSQYRVIHFATHGLLNSRHPELSGIVLSLFDKQGRSQNGFLRLHEIYNLKLPAELVVLSACQTGLGKEIRGEGIVGLTRGFMYAGAARVIASLWKVDDAATAELMSRFYRHMLNEQRRPAEALRMAQLEMYEKRVWRSPYYWAAFVLQGEWN